MKFLKLLGFNFLIWIIGITFCALLLNWELQRNPITANSDGSIPDSLMLLHGLLCRSASGQYFNMDLAKI